jgi:hypothetical protein
MHDRHGRPIEVGDHVKFPTSGGENPREAIGRVDQLYPGTTTCNLYVAVLRFGRVENTSATAAQCELLLKADGTEPPPPAALGG